MIVYSLSFEDVDLQFDDGYGAGGFSGEFDFDADAEVVAVTLRTSRRDGAGMVSHVMRPLARGSWLENQLVEVIQRDYRDQMLEVIEGERPGPGNPFAGLSYANSAGRRL